MVTILRPHNHTTHGYCFHNVNHLHFTSTSTSFLQPVTSLIRPSNKLQLMAQDPSDPYGKQKETPKQQQEAEAEEQRSSSSSSSSDRSTSWLQLGLGPSSSSPRVKRQRTEGPSTSTGPSTSVPVGHEIISRSSAIASSSVQPSRAPQQFTLFPGQESADVGQEAISTRTVVPPPPPSRDAGTWFVLRAAQNQRREPFLPQIPRSYLRIRDERITVRVVMRYLANKLGLQDESEVELTCRGQRLLPSWTLHYVRDNIWRPREAAVLSISSSSSTAEHLMTLHYSRST